MVARKPRHGDPCTRCGVCCYATLCAIGHATFGHLNEQFSFGFGPCPALELDAEGNSACGLADHPERYAPVLTALNGATAMRAAAKTIIAPATGCDCRLNGEARNLDFNARMAAWDIEHADELRHAKTLWRVRE